MDKKRNKYSRRELIHRAMRLTNEMNIHYVNGRSRMATELVTRYNITVKQLAA